MRKRGASRIWLGELTKGVEDHRADWQVREMGTKYVTLQMLKRPANSEPNCEGRRPQPRNGRDDVTVMKERTGRSTRVRATRKRCATPSIMTGHIGWRFQRRDGEVSVAQSRPLGQHLFTARPPPPTAHLKKYRRRCTHTRCAGPDRRRRGRRITMRCGTTFGARDAPATMGGATSAANTCKRCVGMGQRPAV